MELKDIIRIIKHSLYARFSFQSDKKDQFEIVDSIRSGVEFRGSNVWILIFAIFLASIGLNVNSTAVIIGAMLISPLMGPIIGVGLGLSIFDFELLKSSAKNLSIMVVISLLTSTTYFAFTPLHEAQSELLSRTTPTIWDVLIALFGGLAGIVAVASKGKGTVISGVAIATALMPPLCTAGFGLANGDFFFFIGAFYLFCINAVFISLSTLIVTRLLKYHPVVLPDKSRERRLRNIISIVVSITVVPSILIAYFTVQRELFEQRAQKYLTTEFALNNTFILADRVDYDGSVIEIVLAGQAIPEDSIELLTERRINYNLDGVTVRILQGSDFTETFNINELKAGLSNELYADNIRRINEQQGTIAELNEELTHLKARYPTEDIAYELNSLGYGVSQLAIHDNLIFDYEQRSQDTVTIAFIEFIKLPSRSKQQKIQDWLTLRVQADSLVMVLRSK